MVPLSLGSTKAHAIRHQSVCLLARPRHGHRDLRQWPFGCRARQALDLRHGTALARREKPKTVYAAPAASLT